MSFRVFIEYIRKMVIQICAGGPSIHSFPNKKINWLIFLIKSCVFLSVFFQVIRLFYLHSILWVKKRPGRDLNFCAITVVLPKLRKLSLKNTFRINYFLQLKWKKITSLSVYLRLLTLLGKFFPGLESKIINLHIFSIILEFV